jgi:acetyl-CoA carboxylase biotin carboxyl carrier protein
MAKKKNGSPTSAGTAPRADLAEIERILAFMTERGLEEVEYQRGDFHVRLKRQNTSGVVHSVPLAPAQGARQIPTPASVQPSEAGARQPAVPPLAPSEELHTVKSPIVGTFYAAPAPDAPPFVKVGDTVNPGQVLCIVEAMKLMNEIEADQAGQIVRVLVESGQPVEYGQPLFALRPA